MTNYPDLKKFFKTFNEGSYDEAKTTTEFIDSSIDFFSFSELAVIERQLAGYLASKPDDAEMARFWSSCNTLVSFGTDKGLRLFLKMTLRRLKFRRLGQ